jgi:small nuclear ribonucleoprotein (snRNP)-like protein
MNIDKGEVIRYLGGKNKKIDEQMNSIIDECIEEAKQYIKEKYTYKNFDLDKTKDGIVVKGTKLVLEGENIKKHLMNSDSCAIMVATVGVIIENKIRYYEKTNLTKAMILDSCATVAVEELCDEVEGKIKEEAKLRGLGITYRYSPGYGDLSINVQKEIANIVGAYKYVGVTVTENSLLLPRKTVTAIIGYQDKEIIRVHPGCEVCNNRNNCMFRKDGNYCGK